MVSTDKMMVIKRNDNSVLTLASNFKSAKIGTIKGIPENTSKYPASSTSNGEKL